MKRIWIWLLWLALFYAIWLVLVWRGYGMQGLAAHWPIALAMALGSYVAGSTPMGGGTVGFPILVLLLDTTPQLGRDFSFAVQSIGMVSASIFILVRGLVLEWTLLRWAMLGSLLGTPLGVLFVAPAVPGVVIALLFAVIWASFGVLHLYRTRHFAGPSGPAPEDARFDRRAGFALGLAAGLTVVAITGVGIDMLLYALLVLYRRSDLKVAVPTSVVIMAFGALVGIVTKVVFGGVQPGVYEHWLAAAPVVALGAPLGVLVVTLIGRVPTLYFVAVLCLGQFAWCMSQNWSWLGPAGLAVCLVAVVLFNLVFEWVFRLGSRHKLRRLQATGEIAPPAPPGAAGPMIPARPPS